MKRLLALAAGTEVVTGLALIVGPSIVTRLLFGGDLSGPGQALGTLADFGLLALALACWPARDTAGSAAPPFRGMVLFSLLAVLYFVYRGVVGGAVGCWRCSSRVFLLRTQGASRPDEA